MGKIEGSASTEIEAPVERCYEVAADVERMHEWQAGVQKVEVLERDGEGRPHLVRISTETKVRTIGITVRYRYDPPNGISFKQEAGDLKQYDGSWAFAPAGEGRTRVTYTLTGDPGRMLGMLVRGQVEERLRELLVKSRPGELKKRVEGS